jgi:hypothetical protein
MQSLSRRLSSLGLFAALALAGCTGPRGYPSLQPRPIEHVSLAEPVAPPAPPATPGSEAAARYAPMIEQARQADAAFKAALAQGRDALLRGRGAAEGSEAWTEAQEALSRVEAARSPLVSVLADLDAARDSDRAKADSGEMAAAFDAFETVAAIDAAEMQALAEAQGRPR